MIDFINKSDLQFKDISAEEYREYTFSNEAKVKIEKPLLINISDSGGHRLFTESGESHYIPAGWIQLKWVAKPGEAHFDF